MLIAKTIFNNEDEIFLNQEILYQQIKTYQYNYKSCERNLLETFNNNNIPLECKSIKFLYEWEMVLRTTVVILFLGEKEISFDSLIFENST